MASPSKLKETILKETICREPPKKLIVLNFLMSIPALGAPWILSTESWRPSKKKPPRSLFVDVGPHSPLTAGLKNCAQYSQSSFLQRKYTCLKWNGLTLNEHMHALKVCASPERRKQNVLALAIIVIVIHKIFSIPSAQRPNLAFLRYMRSYFLTWSISFAWWFR